MNPRALETEILRLYQIEHWPVGTIAAQLRVHPGTVRRVLAQAGAPAAQATARPSIVVPYRAFIVETLTKYPTLRASRLYTMVRERGYRIGAPGGRVGTIGCTLFAAIAQDPRSSLPRNPRHIPRIPQSGAP